MSLASRLKSNWKGLSIRSSRLRTRAHGGPAPSSESHWILKYGDLAFDLAASLCWSEASGLSILRNFYLSNAGRQLQRFEGRKTERAAVFRALLNQLRESQWRHRRRLTTSEKRMLDANLTEEGRLRQFDSYLHRLALDDLAILLLRDKFGIPLPEIAAIFETPESTLQLQRQQAIDSLCDWIWDTSDQLRPEACFVHQKRTALFYDGKLPPGERSATEAHLSECDLCSEHFQRVQKVLISTRDHVRVFLPADLRGHGITQGRTPLDIRAHGFRFSEIPWFLRTGAESLVITLAVLFAVAFIPRIQRLYESSVNQRLDSLIANNTEESSFFPFASKDEHPETVRPSSRETSALDELPPEEDLAPMAAEGDSDLDEPSVVQEIKAPPGMGPSEVWRFSLRTSSPRDARTRVIGKLKSLGANPENTPGLSGVEAPGGVQFNLVVDRAWVIDIRKFLASLSGVAPVADVVDRNTERTQNPLSTNDPLKWYRSASKSPLPAGKTRIIIWLSQI